MCARLRNLDQHVDGATDLKPMISAIFQPTSTPFPMLWLSCGRSIPMHWNSVMSPDGSLSGIEIAAVEQQTLWMPWNSMKQ